MKESEVTQVAASGVSETASTGMPAVPVGFVPTPTEEYRTRRKARRITMNTSIGKLPGPDVIRIPIPLPRLFLGSRMLIYKQDPTVSEIGIRKTYLPGAVQAGPRDARIVIQGTAPVSPNAFNDFICVPGTEAFDAVHSFAVVRQTLTMYQRASGLAAIPWQWNSATNTDPLNVYPRAGYTMNAYYSRSGKSLKFFYFNNPSDPPGTPIKHFTCRSLDIVAHETGHAVLDALKPQWLGMGNPPQTGGLHESFGDLTSIFLALSQLDQVEAVIAQTKANLHDKTFLSDLAEEFGMVLGRPNGLRNADNDLKLSEVGTEVHAISQVFTGAIYDILADIFVSERHPAKMDDAKLLYDVGQYVLSLVLRAYIAAPATGATYADVANKMISISAADGKPASYRNFIKNRFAFREVVTVPAALAAADDKAALKALIVDAPGAQQDRRGCCGTMQLGEYCGASEAIDEELRELAGASKTAKARGGS